MRSILALVLALLPAAAMGQVLHSADVLPPEHPTVQSVVGLGEVLSARTGGRLQIDLNAGTSHSESFMVAQVRLGRLDMARVNFNALSGIAPLSVVPTLPFMFESRAKKWRALDGAFRQDLFGSLERAGLVGLALYDSGAYSFFSRTGFINNVADLKGRRIRFQKGNMSEAMFGRLGADPIIAPHTQLFAALEAGTIDMAEGSMTEYLALNYVAVAPYFTVSRHAEPPSVLIMSLLTWRSLSRQDQDLLREAAASSAERQRALMDDYEAEAAAQATERGARISHDFDRQSFKKAFAPLYPLVVREGSQVGWLKRLATEDAGPDEHTTTR